MKDEIVAPLTFLVVTILVVSACAFLGWHHGGMAKQSELQRDAIEHGVAEWTIDPKSGERAFRWKGEP